MKTIFFTLVMFFAVFSVQAQDNKTVETQRDVYGHITGTVTTTTDSHGRVTQPTVISTATLPARRPAIPTVTARQTPLIVISMAT